MNYLDPYPDGKAPVLLLHGLGADASSWKMQFDALGKAGFRPLSVDLPGFGRTPHTGKWTLRETAQRVAEFVDELGFRSFDLVGISMGGVVAQLFAHNYPDRMRKLVLVNTFACLRPRRFGDWAYLLRRLWVANLRGVEYQAQLVANRLFPEANQADLREEMIRRILDSDRKVYRTAMTQLGIFDSRKWLPEIKCPTLVISGRLDTTVPLENQVELARLIPAADHAVIDGARHAIIVDKVEEFNRVLVEFLLRPPEQ